MSVFFPFTHLLSMFEINITFVGFEGVGRISDSGFKPLEH